MKRPRPGIDFEIPEDFCHMPAPTRAFLEAGCLVLIDRQLLPEGMTGSLVSITDNGVEITNNQPYCYLRRDLNDISGPEQDDDEIPF
jgi:hypothetical protein